MWCIQLSEFIAQFLLLRSIQFNGQAEPYEFLLYAGLYPMVPTKGKPRTNATSGNVTIDYWLDPILDLSESVLFMLLVSNKEFTHMYMNQLDKISKIMDASSSNNLTYKKNILTFKNKSTVLSLVATVLSLYEKIIYRIYVFSMCPAACNCFTTYCPATTLINHGKRPMTNEILGRIFVIANGLHAYRCQLSAKHALPFVAGLIRSYRAFYIVTENEKHRYKHRCSTI